MPELNEQQVAIRIGLNIQGLRVAKGWTAIDLARKIGNTVRHLLNWEEGTCCPGSANLIRLALALECSADDILGIQHDQ
jgi:transcriptional regulator with XRE-family HTH domain